MLREAVNRSRLEQRAKHARLLIAEQPREQFGEMEQVRRAMGSCGCERGRRGSLDCRDQACRKLPAFEQPGGERSVVETKRPPLDRQQITFLGGHAVDKAGVGFAKLLQQQEHTQVLEQTGEECFVARLPPHCLGQFSGGDRLDKRVPPVAGQRVGGDPAVQFAGQTEAQDEHF